MKQGPQLLSGSGRSTFSIFPFVLYLLFLLPAAYAQSITPDSIITTVAGIGRVFQGDGGPATNATLGFVQGIAVDAAGNVFATDTDNSIVVKITPNGTLTVVAGNGIKAFSGDGGPATGASLNLPTGVAVDAAGNLYIADQENNRIRRVSADGTIYTVAGGCCPTEGLGDGGLATSAILSFPQDVAIDVAGNLYIADSSNHRIRKVDSATGIISTVAGSGTLFDVDGGGFSGDGGPATSALLNGPNGIAVDVAGNLYVTDSGNGRIRKVSSEGVITTIAENLGPINGPLSVDEIGNVYIPGGFTHRIRMISPQGVVTTVAGSADPGALGAFSGDGGLAASARLNEPRGVAVDTAGNIYIADTINQRIRKVTSSGIITTIAGVGAQSYGDGGPATSAALNHPEGIVVDGAGNFYISDTRNHRVRKVSANGIITTVAGNGIQGFSGDGGPGPLASLNEPLGLELGPGGELYIADSQNNRVRRLSSTGIMTTFAGGRGPVAELGDGGPAVNAEVTNPRDVALDNAGNLYIASDFQRIRKVSPNGIISTVVSNLDCCPEGITVDSASNLFVAVNARILKITTNGTVSTVAGTGKCCFSGDGGPATAADLNGTSDTVLDGWGNLFISTLNQVRVVDSNGIISTLVGGIVAVEGFLGDGGPVVSSGVAGPRDIAFDQAGNLYIVDEGNDRIRKVLTTAPVFSALPSSLSFTASAGAAEVPTQQITVSGGLAGLSWSASVSTESGGNWLTISPAAGSTPGEVDVSVNAVILSPGTYHGTVTITAPLASPPVQTVSVTLSVTEPIPPRLEVELNSLSFSFNQQSSSGSAQISLSNQGSTSLDFSSSAVTDTGGGWLTVSPPVGSLTAFGSTTLTVAANPAGLLPDTYTGSVTIQSSATGQSIRLPVSMAVSGIPQTILLSQTGLTFTAVAQGGAVPPQTFGVLNTGQGTMSWIARGSTLSGGPSWLTVTPDGGATDATSLRVPLVEVGVDHRGLAPGEYYGQVQVSSATADNSPQIVSVILEVLPPGSNPGPLVRPTGLIFTAVAGGTSPGSQNVSVANLTDTATNYTSGRLTYDGEGWFVNVPNTDTVVPERESRIVVQPDLEGLEPGIRNGVLTLLFAGGAVQTVDQLFVVIPGGGVSTQAAGNAANGDCTPTVLLPLFTSLARRFRIRSSWPSPVEVRVVDDCGNPMVSGVVVATFSNGDPLVVLNHLGDGVWVGTWVPSNVTPQTIVRVSAETSEPRIQGTVQVTGSLQGNLNVPLVGQGGIVNGASFAGGEPVAPGGIISVFGRNLAEGENTATQLPLEKNLGGATVNIGGIDAPLFFSSEGQINAQVPYELTPNTRPHVVVRTTGTGGGQTLTLPQIVTVAAARPAIFTVNQQGTGQGAILNQDNSENSAMNPATRGNVIQIFATGLGATNPVVPSGEPAPGNPPALATAAVEALIGGQPASVQFAGLAPGFVGLYQVNVTIPPTIQPGTEVELTLTQNDVPSNTVTLAVQ